MRRFLRCPDCLFVWSVEIDDARFRAPENGHIAQHGAWATTSRIRNVLQPYLDAGCVLDCGCSVVEDMGQLNGSGTILKETVKCVCNETCTHAQGPDCECECGGMNHGIGIFGDYIQCKETGKLKGSMRERPKSADKALARAREWRALHAKVREASAGAVGDASAVLYEKRRQTRWLSDEDFERHRLIGKWQTACRELNDRRTHAGRIKAAEKLLAQVDGLVARAR